MYRLKVEAHFDAAHFIRDYEGKCSREHGHRWTIVVVFEGDTLDLRNMLVDFSDVKRALGRIVDNLDHWQLNTQLDEPNVTAEFLAHYVYCRLQVQMREVPELRTAAIKLVSAEVRESPTCGVEYTE